MIGSACFGGLLKIAPRTAAIQEIIKQTVATEIATVFNTPSSLMTLIITAVIARETE